MDESSRVLNQDAKELHCNQKHQFWKVGSERQMKYVSTYYLIYNFTEPQNSILMHFKLRAVVVKKRFQTIDKYRCKEIALKSRSGNVHIHYTHTAFGIKQCIQYLSTRLKDSLLKQLTYFQNFFDLTQNTKIFKKVMTTFLYL